MRAHLVGGQFDGLVVDDVHGAAVEAPVSYNGGRTTPCVDYHVYVPTTWDGDDEATFTFDHVRKCDHSA